MKAIRRNVLLACIISTFCFFGALGKKPVSYNAHHVVIKQTAAEAREARKETFTLLAVAGIAWTLCFWRCAVINRRLSQERVFKSRFDQYVRNNVYANRR